MNRVEAESRGGRRVKGQLVDAGGGTPGKSLSVGHQEGKEVARWKEEVDAREEVPR